MTPVHRPHLPDLAWEVSGGRNYFVVPIFYKKLKMSGVFATVRRFKSFKSQDSFPSGFKIDVCIEPDRRQVF